MTLLELAERCEAAAGPDRELDQDIALALGWSPIPNPTKAGGLVGRWTQPDGTMSGMEGPPQWTASLDAALSLVPEGFDWTLGRTNGGLTIHAEVGGHGGDFMRFAESPALALCAAALRARSTTPNTKETAA